MMSVGVYLRIESGDETITNVPGVHQFHIKSGGNVIDLLVAAEKYNPHYSFSSRHIHAFGDVVTSLCGVFNDPERNLAWFFYSPGNQIIEEALSKVQLTSGDEVVARFEKFNRDEQKAQVNKK